MRLRVTVGLFVREFVCVDRFPMYYSQCIIPCVLFPMYYSLCIRVIPRVEAYLSKRGLCISVVCINKTLHDSRMLYHSCNTAVWEGFRKDGQKDQSKERALAPKRMGEACM